MSTIAVTGATGQLGGSIIKNLVAKNASNIIALVRAPEKFTRAGVSARAFDYSKSDTLIPGLTGVSVLILVSSNNLAPGERVKEHILVVDAAKAAGVKTIIYTSILRAPALALRLAQDHNATEEYITASGIQSVFLRNGWYLENWTNSVGGAIAGGGVLGANQNAKLSPATVNDYGEAAANVAIRARDGKTVKKAYELGGVTITLSEYAEEVSKHAGKTLPYVDLSQEKYTGMLLSFGLPQVLADYVADSEVRASKGALYVETTDLIELLGRQPEDWREHVKNAVIPKEQ